jgi:uncharacterized protein
MSNFQTISTGVFDRSGRDTLSPQAFYGALTSSILYGLFTTAVIAYKVNESGFMPNLWHIIILGLVIPIIGIIVAMKSDNPIFSFLGYSMVVLPFGVVLSPVLQVYSPDVITNAFGITAAITFIMGLAGTMFPNIFSKMGPVLGLVLFGMILVMIGQMFIPALRLGIIDYIGAGLFSLYIGYDVYRANHMPKTLDNAIDISIDLYLDIINLFLFILRITGNKD